MKRKKILVITGLITILITVLVFFNNSRFSISSTFPNNNNYPSSLSTLEIKFNKELDKKFINNKFNEDPKLIINTSFDSSAKIDVYDRSIKFTFKQIPLKGDYKISINNIRSSNGSILSKELKLKVRDISYDKLSKEEKELYDNFASIGEDTPDDKAFSILPHETNDYIITYSINPGIEAPPTITITSKIYPPGDNALPATEDQLTEYRSKLTQFRKEALEWLKANSINTSEYTIKYPEPY